MRHASIQNRVCRWENIELISDRPFATMLEELKQLREEYPDRVLIASIMEEYNKDAWEEIVGRCEEVGVDAFEINFSCPHGMPERRMGMAMGQDPDILSEVCCICMQFLSVPLLPPCASACTRCMPGRWMCQATLYGARVCCKFVCCRCVGGLMQLPRSRCGRR
jgi:hypothetical protein